jgi:peptidoglycan DL-endopeptidase CwlO
MLGTGSIAVSLGLSLLGGQLVATQPASAATSSSAVMAAAAAKVKTKVTQSVNKKTISYGSTVKVTAKVVDTRTGKVVKAGGRIALQAHRNKAWRNWQIRTLPKSGVITFTSRPLVTGSYRTVYFGGSTYAVGSTSAVKVTVKTSAAKVLAEAKKHVGALYKYGAAGPKRFDCSGFTMYVYRKAIGSKLPHKAHSQQRWGYPVAKSKAQPGDLIVFRRGSYGYHAAIYAGNGYMYDAPGRGRTVGKHKIWSKNYVVRRLV